MTSPISATDSPRVPGQQTGLTLSGGGFRATLFHLGVVRFLHEEKKLKDVTHVCSVSGGSILAAHLVLNWERYTSEKEEDFNAAARELVEFVKCDLRGRVIRPWLVSWLAAGIPRLVSRLTGHRRAWWRTSLLQRGYERLYRGAKLQNLEGPGRPELHLLATSFTTGHLVTFAQGEMRFCGELVPDPEFMPAGHIPVALAVTASSAFPPLFPPVRVSHETFGAPEDMFPNRHYLTDGGVFDNLGIRRLLWLLKPEDRFDTIVVSDAQRSLAKEYGHEYNQTLGRTSRCVDLMMDRVSWFESAAAREVIGKFQGHLVYCALPKRPEEVLTEDYAPSSVNQFQVATTRTDLDLFTDDEIDAIVHEGYATARAAAQKEGLCGEWPAGRKVWHPANPDRADGYELTGIERRTSGLFRLNHWSTWALWGLVALWLAIPVGLFVTQYNLKAAAQAKLLATERAAKYVKTVRMLGEVVLSGNVESAERRKREWAKFRPELQKDPAFAAFLGSGELSALEAAFQGSWPYPPGTERHVLSLAKTVRANLERSGGAEYLEFQRESRSQLYDEVREAVTQISSVGKPKLDQVPNSRRQFWRLYWGPMALVEGPEVEQAMVAYGNIVRRWEESKQDASPGLKAELATAERSLRVALQAEQPR